MAQHENSQSQANTEEGVNLEITNLETENHDTTLPHRRQNQSGYPGATTRIRDTPSTGRANYLAHTDKTNGALFPDNSSRITEQSTKDQTRQESQNVPPSRGTPRPMSARAKELWKPFLRKMLAKYRVKRMLESFRKSAGTPCTRCASMKLTEAKFMILEPSKHKRINRTVETPDKSPRSRHTHEDLGPDGLGFGPHEFRLGTLEELYEKRENCPFCSLAVTSLDHQYKTLTQEVNSQLQTKEQFYNSQIVCWVSWQIDGRTLSRDSNGKIIGHRPCTRRLRLRWEVSNSSTIKELFDTYVVLVAPRNGGNGLFFGRALNTVKTDAALVRRWISFCEASHGDSCKSEARGFPLPKSFFGVVDVKEMCLTKLPDTARYVALSYMWGRGGHDFKTTTNNVRDFLKPGGIRKVDLLMPRTIKDAINLVRDVGERYLWVDSFCIIQGSDRSWALNSRIMDQVYGNAYFTICAADGEGSGAGLHILNPRTSNTDGDERERSLSQNITQYGANIRLMSTQPAENYIRKSKWNTRGWTFQERVLSPRNLIFTADRMYFQCRCTARTADIISEDESAGWSIEFQDSPLLMLQRLPHRPLSVYKEALELYMIRELTNSKDILAAFTGMGNLVCNALGGSFVYGLPSSHFDWALLWEPHDAAVRRPGEGGEKFPSWSWCGWKNQIMEYKDKMLGGCEENLHDWLMKRTWIVWYIRDGNGNLRLVWDGESETKSVQDVSWKGYHLPSDFSETIHDKYGRYVKKDERETRLDHCDKFELILDECPYGVDIVGKVDFNTDARSSSTERDMPYLQFKTWSAFFRIEEDLCRSEEDNRPSSKTQKIFRRYSILDYKDDWCGTILLDKFWVEIEGQVPTRDLDVPLEFIALSYAKQFSSDEYGAWANYIPMARKDSSWDLYYVMLIETKAGISQRVGLGKVFKDAFDSSCRPEGKQWREFILE